MRCTLKLAFIVLAGLAVSGVHWTAYADTPSAAPVLPASIAPSLAASPLRTVAHHALGLERAALPVRPEMEALLEAVIRSAAAAYQEAAPRFSLLPARDRALQTLELLENVLQRFHFVYPAVGQVATLRDGLAAVNLDARSRAALLEEPENRQRRTMIQRSPAAAFHLADCDVLSLLYVAMGEALGLPLAMVDLPEPAWGGASHSYVAWTFDDGTRVDWEAMSGTERAAAEADAVFFSGSPRTLEQAAKARAYAVPMSRVETLAYWHLVVAGLWRQLGADDLALAGYREAVRRNPASPRAYNDLAWMLATSSDSSVRKPAEAVTVAEKLIELWPSANNLDTAAAAYAAAGRWGDAKRMQQRAVQAAVAYDLRADGFRSRLILYENEQAYLAPRREELEAEDWRQRLQQSRWKARTPSIR